MSLRDELLKRSNCCELCGSSENLDEKEIEPSDGTIEQSILLCKICKNRLDNENLDEKDWHCLSNSMWSEIPAVKVMAYRILKKLNLQEQLDMLYLEDDIKAWADNEKVTLIVKDSNGVLLVAGDNVTIIKDLDVKGANFTAKRGTLVKNIFITDNPEEIEGRVNGTRIVLKTCFLKKS